jgi:hypothetical protein
MRSKFRFRVKPCQILNTIVLTCLATYEYTKYLTERQVISYLLNTAYR